MVNHGDRLLMGETRMEKEGPADEAGDLDVIIVGAGIAGLYMLHKLRESGFRARVLEQAAGVGGTWFWNRYPGARVDVESIEYSYSFSKEIEQEWDWTELMPTQPEMESYLNFVADRLDLRRDIQLRTRVASAAFSDESSTWTVETEAGERFVAPFCVMATGSLSVPLEPDIEGLESFQGTVLRTSRWPREKVDFAGKRVAVIGTGSSGVQCIPVIAQEAGTVVVFQRSAAFTRPANNRPLAEGELAELKASYADIRAQQRAAPSGALRSGAIYLSDLKFQTGKLIDSTLEERRKQLAEKSWMAPLAWTDVLVDPSANSLAVEMYGELVRTIVRDGATAASLVPHYPIGCKRQILDTNYFETFNLGHVSLVDLRKGAISRVTQSSIETEQGDFEFDVIVLATGFDAITGALSRIDIRGREGRSLRDLWSREGAKTYLGLEVAGFPNLFVVAGPGSPSVTTNMFVAIEQHVEWIADCLSYLRDSGYAEIEATEEAQEAWVDHVASVVAGQVYTWDTCNSWYLGANVPGKKRVYLPYRGGLPAYRRRCEEVAQSGYAGFRLSTGPSAPEEKGK
jgi:cation diffusion facilitator CzcD-associated flavoprotein CzcO